MKISHFPIVLAVIFINCFTANAYYVPSDNYVIIYSDDTTIQKIHFRAKTDIEADQKVKNYLLQEFPIISENTINEIIESKEVNIFEIDSLGNSDTYSFYNVPVNYLIPHPEILWELNIPEFRSRIYQIYQEDTILIDVWSNVVGAPASKTYTGNYKAFRIRNWPTWKDPEKPESEPTPPGVGNPLGLFTVHYDENSLRYFHGTNQNKLLKNEYRALSHGCVRNDNANIDKMKRFIVKKVVKSTDLKSWENSKKSLSYNLQEEDKFPVRIIYKTFNVGLDESGVYIEFFKDCYGYEKNQKLSKFDDPDLIFPSTVENIVNEYKAEIFESNLNDEQLVPVIQNLLKNRKYYQKYYLDNYYPHTEN